VRDAAQKALDSINIESVRKTADSPVKK